MSTSAPEEKEPQPHARPAGQIAWYRRLVQHISPQRSITIRLGLAIGLTTILFAILEGLTIDRGARALLEQTAGTEMKNLAIELADKLDRGMFERYRDIQSLAMLDPIRDPSTPPARRRALLETLKRTYPDYAWIGLADMQGNVVASTGGILTGANVAERPWFQNGQQRPYVGDVHEELPLGNLLPLPETSIRMVDIAAPVYDDHGRLQGVLGAALSWSWASDVQSSLLTQTQQQAQIDLFVLNSQGIVVLGSDPNTTKQLVALSSVRAALKNQSSYCIDQWPDQQAYLTGFARSQGYRDYPGVGWVVLARQPTAVAFAPSLRLQQILLLWNAVIAVLCVLVGWALIQRIASPLRLIADVADRIRQGDHGASMPLVHGRDEIALLSTSLTSLVQTLQQHEETLQQQNLQLRHELDERQALVAALRESEERFRLLVAAVRDYAIFMLGPDGVVVSWNAGAQEMIGYRADQIIGRQAAILYPPDDIQANIPEQTLQIARHNGRYEDEGPRLRADGSRFLAHTIVTPMYDSNAGLRGFASVIRNITERKRLEQQLFRAQKMEGIGRLAGGVAHDFNNVLTAIGGYADLLLDSVPAESQAGEDVREIQRAVERASTLTRQLLAFARRQPLDPGPININELIRELERMLRRLIGEDIDLKIHLLPGLPQIIGDAGQIEQLIVNLAVNARDAMPSGGALMIETDMVMLDPQTTQLQIDIPPGEYIVLSVSDNGVGMSPEVQARLFEPFFTTKDPGKGTGLGLSTCYGIVKQHSGTIWFYSEPGRGTSFKIYLPPTSLHQGPSSRLLADESLPHGSETALVAEDDPAVRTLVVRVLRACGYTVLEAADGDEALQLARYYSTSIIDLLLTDVVMPRRNGESIAADLRALYPRCKVLFMSGYADESMNQNGARYQSGLTIHKPFTAAALAQKVRAILDEREQERSS